MKTILKGATAIDTSTLASKTDLASRKTKVDGLDVNKLKAIPADSSKLSNVVDSDVIKRLCMMNWLSKSMLLILTYQVLVDYSLKYNMILRNKVLRRRFRILTKRYSILVGY